VLLLIIIVIIIIGIVVGVSDVQQHVAGSCDLSDIAVKVATRVIGHYPHRNQLLVDAGWMAMSLDGHEKLPSGSYCVFQHHPDLRFSLSQGAATLEIWRNLLFLETRGGGIQ